MNRLTNRYLRKMWLLLLAATTSCIITSCIMEEEPEAWSLGAGDSLPEFTVVTIDGRRVSTADFAGKRGYIVFFSTECGDCRRELPRLEEYYRGMPEEVTEFICISRAQGRKEVEAYWEANGFTMAVAAETDRSVYNLFATSGIPRLYVTEGIKITGAQSEILTLPVEF